ncbi:MAG TPA: tetratricopeptide repeat protein [Streptosporangiaceae bacterium]|jgi:nucleoside phosphorylase
MSDAYDLGLIIPLREEFDCAREILDFDRAILDDGRYLHPFTVPGSELRGIAVVLYDMGLTGSAVATSRLLDRYQLRMLALIGIAGALDNRLRLGDLVVASSIDEYLYSAKAAPNGSGRGFGFEVGGNSWTASRDLVNFVNNFRYLPGSFEAWGERARSRRNPGLLSKTGTLTKGTPEYLVGPIASGDVVGAADGFAQWLLHHNRLRLAIEMEAGGAARAIYESGRTDLLVVRGISDFADERKKKLDAFSDSGADRGAWRRYAALNAVDLLAALVTNPDFPWTSESAAQAADTKDIRRQERTLSDLEQRLGGGHRRTLTARNNLAHAYNAAGYPARAQPHYAAVVIGFEKLQGKEHQDTLTARSNLAAAYRATGQAAEALALDRRVLADRDRVLGSEHSDTITSRNNLAADYFELGRSGEAAGLLRRVLADRERLHGSGHPSTQAARENLAVALGEQVSRVD